MLKENSAKIKVAVVILNWNGINYLKKFLPSVVQYSENEHVNIYVADNNSTDNSVNFVKTNYPQIKIIQLLENFGFAGGYNKALKQINAEYFILLNSDVEVTENWIMPIINKMDLDNSISAAMAKIKSFAEKNKFEYAGAAGGFIDKFGYPFCRGRILNTIEEDNGQYDDEKEVFWASGAAMFVKAEVFNILGGFDDDFFAHMEEIDLCWRMKNNGYKIMYYFDSQVFHVGGGALPNNSPHKLYLNYRNNLLMLFKNLPKEKLFTIIFIRLILDGISALIYLLKFQFPNFYAVFKAHMFFYKLMPKFKKKRNENNISKDDEINNQIYTKSIVYQYIINKKTSFEKLRF
ncbi:MAG: glycosyltransferase family 2 protein [Bacteroidales bacterium]|nr:glycosyltransferase family 2 protein [Bacteroidales bacterium]MBN2757181.1 glycosyltransferase family 2 protein [Bacteroidales bacterium]